MKTEDLNLPVFRQVAQECGFELAGVAPVGALEEYPFFQQWVTDGMAGEMGYLTDRRGELREDPRKLLPSARSVLCLGKHYNTGGAAGTVSRYAWGADYHDVLRRGLEQLVSRLKERWGDFEAKICVDTAPLLERALAQKAGLGWIGKNTCLINQDEGSWFFLGEVLTSLESVGDSRAMEDRCGTCVRCIEACPTQAIVPAQNKRGWQVDSRECLSYLTIELRGAIPERLRAPMGDHLFGCDICQDVCPWNGRAAVTSETGFRPLHATPDLALAAKQTAEEFRAQYRSSPLWRAKHRGFLRNVAVVLGNRGRSEDRPALEILAAHEDPLVREHAEWALRRLS